MSMGFLLVAKYIAAPRNVKMNYTYLMVRNLEKPGWNQEVPAASC